MYVRWENPMYVVRFSICTFFKTYNLICTFFVRFVRFCTFCTFFVRFVRFCTFYTFFVRFRIYLLYVLLIEVEGEDTAANDVGIFFSGFYKN